MDAAVSAPKPLFRGVLHQHAAPTALGVGLLLAAIAAPGRPTLATLVFAASLVTLFTVSAVYHRVDWSPAARVWMRRADHAAIFVLIAGTYTPVALVALGGTDGMRLFAGVWGAALLGVLKSLFWAGSPKPVTAALAVAVGWSVIPYFSAVRAASGPLSFGLLLGGGVAYVLGAIAYATKRPALRPTIFGYHEVFHALTLLGASAHAWAIFRMIRGLR